MYNRKPLPLPPPDRVILSVREAAAVAELGHNTIRKLIKNRELPHKRVGRRILIRRDDLNNFLKPE